MGILYIVATPIGNLQDITLRAMDILISSEFLLCEDTRTTGNLLNFIYKQKSNSEKKPRLIPFYEGNEVKVIEETITTLKNGFNIAVVSDAGTPTISDPGFKLVRECLKQGIRVESIPGPSSVISALVSSGLPTDKFLFLGFLPEKIGHRLTLLENLNQTLKLVSSTAIIFESPYRLVKTLEEIKSIFGDIEITIARELTKIHEEVKSGLITEQVKHYKKGVKGEIVLLFNLK